MLYVPNLEQYKCVVIRDTNTIRAYREIPQTNTTIDFTDYYVNSNYMSQEGIQTFNQYANLPICHDSSLLTDEYYYRNDISQIFFCILFLMLILIIPFKILFRLFRRFN